MRSGEVFAISNVAKNVAKSAIHNVLRFLRINTAFPFAPIPGIILLIGGNLGSRAKIKSVLSFNPSTLSLSPYRYNLTVGRRLPIVGTFGTKYVAIAGGYTDFDVEETSIELLTYGDHASTLLLDSRMRFKRRLSASAVLGEWAYTVQSSMKVGNNAFFHCFLVVAYWLSCQQLTNKIWLL